MNSTERYSRYALCREMLQTPEIVRTLDDSCITEIRLASDRVLLSGEGSSRIFPAKRLIAYAMTVGWPLRIHTEAAIQAMEYPLPRYHVFVASNSGRTAEGVRLIRHLRAGAQGTVGDAAGAAPASDTYQARCSDPVSAITGIVANDGTPIAEEADNRIVLQCGPEEAVAATKSVIEQALVYDILFRNAFGAAPPDRSALADYLETALTLQLDVEMIDRIVASPVLYFAGRNDGVAEELALKTNEITRKRSAFLEGTFAVHGIEEVMQPEETVILIDPFPSQEEKFDEVLRRGVGLNVVAIAPRPTRFPTIQIPDAGVLTPYALLAAGWNVLADVGIAAGIDLDKPQRARKVGNEFQEGSD